MYDIQNMLSTLKMKFIEERTKEEEKIAAYAKAVSSVNIEEVFGDTYVPPEISLRALCPEAYKDNPDINVYDQQFDEMKRIFDAMNAKVMEYNREALELYNKFKQME